MFRGSCGLYVVNKGIVVFGSSIKGSLTKGTIIQKSDFLDQATTALLNEITSKF